MIRKILLAVTLAWSCISAAYAGVPYSLSKDFEVAQLMGMAGGQTSGGPVLVTAECGLSGVSCAAAYSLTHEIVTGATKAFNLSDSTGGAGHNVDVGFTSTGLINMATINTFCNALPGDSPCLLHTVYDQTGNGCDVTYTLADNAPIAIYAPNNLPAYLIGHSTTTLVGHLEKTSCATALGGNAAKTIIMSTNNFGSSSCCGTLMGLGENTPGIVTASLFTGLQYEPTAGGPVYVGADLEGCGTVNPGCANTSALGNPTYGGVPDIISEVYDGAGHFLTYENGTQTGTTWTGTGSYTSLVTQNRMIFGSAGDNTNTGPAFMQDFILHTGAMTGTVEASISSSWQALYAAQTANKAGSLDVQQSIPASLRDTTTVTWGYMANGLRQLTASYLGPLANVCKGTSSTCEDIPQNGSGAMAWATAAAYCGSDATATLATSSGTTLTVAGTTTGTFAIGMQIQGTGFTNVTFITAGTGPTYTTNVSNTIGTGEPITGNDCTVKTLYSQASQAFTPFAPNYYTGSDASDSGTAANRPWLYFNIPGITSGTGGMYFNGAQKLCLANVNSVYNPGGTNAVVQDVVAERSGNTSNYQAVEGGQDAAWFIGFGNAANSAYSEYGGGGAGSITITGINDNAMHSLAYAYSTSPTTTSYADASSGTSASNAPNSLTDASNAMCIGVSPGPNSFFLTGYVEETLIFGGATFSSTDVAHLRTAQRAAWGY